MDKVSEKLISIGHLLLKLPSEGRLELRPLKALKNGELIPYLSPEYNAEKRFVAFFLINFLDDVFYNLVGDFPYDKPLGKEADSIRREFFRGLGTELCAIGEALVRDYFPTIYEHLTRLVVLYLHNIDAINGLNEIETQE